MSKPALKVEDFTDKFKKTIESFKRDVVLVGIPEEKTERKEQEPIGNAALLAINEFGSPANNIPPRPVMKIGIKNASAEIAEQFKLAVLKSFSSGANATGQYYQRAGIIASNSIKKAINAQEGISPPSEATLAAREAAGFKGTKALIVTGQMRNAITYVVRKKFE